MSAEALGATRPYVFHVDLAGAPAGYDYVVITPGQEQRLAAHTKETKQQLLSAKTLSAAQAERFGATTHFTLSAVMMPIERAYRVHVKAIPHDASRPSFAQGVAISVPKQGMTENESADEMIDWVSTAQSFIFHHPDLETTDPNVSAIVMQHLSQETHPSNYQLI